MAELAAEFEVHLHQIQNWKKQLINSADEVFEKPISKKENPAETASELYKKIGQLTIERDSLARKLGH